MHAHPMRTYHRSVAPCDRDVLRDEIMDVCDARDVRMGVVNGIFCSSQ